jgi:ribonuclease P protein component
MPDYPKSARILRPQDFRQTYDQGTRHACALFAVFVRRRDDDLPARFGFTTPRALGKANIRNRLRRRLRECVRLERDRFPHGFNIVFNPRKSLLDAPWAEVHRQVDKLIQRLITQTDTAPCDSSSSPS